MCDLKIFIVGNSRSGTTMLGRILGNHSQVYTFGELHFFEQMVREEELCVHWEHNKLVEMLERLLTSSRKGLFCTVNRGEYRGDAENILKLSEKRSPASVYACFLEQEAKQHGKIIPCEQTPRYLYSVGAILALFPNARMINLVRDPRDVLLSQKNKWRRRFLGAKNIPLSEAFRAWVNYHPYTISKLWVSSVRTAERFKDHSQFMSLRFEDLLNNPEESIRRICAFTGLDYEENMLNVPQVGSSSGKDKPDQMGVDQNRISAWKRGGLTQTEIAVCQSVAGVEMNRLGYMQEDINIPIWIKGRVIFTFILKAPLALLLNLKRSKNIVQTIKRRLIKPVEKV